MEINNYTPQDIVQKNIAFVTDTAKLTRADTALQILPPDTQFAIVIEAIERNAGESFAEMDTASTGMAGAATVGSEGLRGRFVGYAAVGSQKLRIYRGSQLLFEEQVSNVRAHFKGGCIIGNSTKVYKIISVLQITVAVQFESHASGLNGGLDPLLNTLQAGGAAVERPSKTLSAVFAIMLLVFLVAMGLAVLIFGHKK